MEHLKIVKPDEIKNQFRKNFIIWFILFYIMRELIYAVIYVKGGRESLDDVKSLYGWALMWSAIDGVILVLTWKIAAILSFKDRAVRVQELEILKSFFTMMSIVVCVFITIIFLNNMRTSIQEYEKKIDAYQKIYELFNTDKSINFDNYKENYLKEFKKIIRTTILIRILLGVGCNILGHCCIRKDIEKIGLPEEIYNELIARDKAKEEKVESSYSSDEMGNINS